MANICFTEVTIKTSQKRSADILERRFVETLFPDPAKPDPEDRWLGNLLVQLGMPKEDVLNGKALRCRGTVVYFMRDDDKTISLSTESAWVPMIKCIRKFVDAHVDDAEVFYIAEEPNMDIFWTNNPDVAGNVWVDWEEVSAETEKFLVSVRDKKEKDATKAFEERLGHPGKLEKLAEELAETENAFISVHTYEYRDATD